MNKMNVSRRGFLQISASAAGGLMIGFPGITLWLPGFLD